MRKMWLQCAKGNDYTKTARKRLTSSRMTSCPFTLTLTRTAIGWRVEVQDPTHNHQAFAHAGALPHYRQRTEETKKTIADMSASSINPSKILTNLLKKDITISIQDIYNERQANKKKLLGGLSSVQALLKALDEHGGDDPESKYYFAHEEDDRDRVKYLFFAHPESLKYFQKNPDVLLIDCTYKTNKFKMPFLHAVGVSNTGQNFELAYCFLPGETEADYNFAIQQIYLLYCRYNVTPKVVITDKELALKNALRTYFPSVPQLLCLWHVAKNVLTHVQDNWVVKADQSDEENEKAQEHRDNFMKRWVDCYSQKSLEKFTAAWHQLIEDYHDQERLTNYLRDEWWPYRRAFVTCYTDIWMHFGNR